MTPTHIACLFPGQGSQRKGMGGDLFERYASLCAAADEILGYSVQELCLVNPNGNLRHTRFTQPALYVVNALTWLERTERLPPPDFLAGHSLGEYDALFAAGCFDFATGLRLVKRRGELMSQVEEGGMAAVLGLDAEQVRAVLEAHGAAVDIANFNLPTQLVLSGPKKALEELIEPMQQAGARKCLMLNVSGAFHSRYMASTATEFEVFLRDFSFTPPRIPVVANASARPYAADSVASHLVDQIRTSVRWSETMDYLRRHGVTEVEELGPGKVLANLWTAADKELGAWLTVAAEGGAGPAPAAPELAAEELGDAAFRRDYGLRFAYVAGSPARGTRPAEWVISLGKAGLLGFLDDFEGGPEEAALAIERTARALGPDGSFGVSLHGDPSRSAAPGETAEEWTVTAALRHGVRCAEAVGYRRITPALIRFRFRGARRDEAGRPVAVNRLLALVTRPGVAARFLSPVPEELLAALLESGELSAAEGEIARSLPVASDLCAVAGTGESADMTQLLPAITRLRDESALQHGHARRVRVGAGGAVGSPATVACAFLLGADFVHTSSINLCCREARMSTAVKQLLAGLEVADTVGAAAADGFSLGARVQVVKKGSLFAPRAAKLYELFRFHDSLESIDPAQRQRLQTLWFKRSFASIADSLRVEGLLEPGTGDAKNEMAQVFTWYLRQSLRWAIDGAPGEEVNYQIPCDEAMAAFNLFVAGTDLADVPGRGVAVVGERLMRASAAFLARRLDAWRPRPGG